MANAKAPGVKYGVSYGTFYIKTGDTRGRDIHGGGRGATVPDPYAPYQRWLGTYGCLRMKNADGEELSRLMIDHGNQIPLTVQPEPYVEPPTDGKIGYVTGGGTHSALYLAF